MKALNKVFFVSFAYPHRNTCAVSVLVLYFGCEQRFFLSTQYIYIYIDVDDDDGAGVIMKIVDNERLF